MTLLIPNSLQYYYLIIVAVAGILYIIGMLLLNHKKTEYRSTTKKENEYDEIIKLRDKLKDRQSWLINSINRNLDDAITLKDLNKLKVSIEKEIDKQDSLI